jgi:hypothetical protein
MYSYSSYKQLVPVRSLPQCLTCRMLTVSQPCYLTFKCQNWKPNAGSYRTLLQNDSL